MISAPRFFGGFIHPALPNKQRYADFIFCDNNIQEL